MICKFFIISLAFLFHFFIPGSAKAQTIISVELTIDAPFSRATLSMDEHGNMHYRAYPTRGVDRKVEEASSKVTAAEFNELVDLIKSGDFFSKEDKYYDNNVMDLSEFTVTVKTDEISKTITCYGVCPPEISAIIDKMKKFWGKEILEIGV